MYCLFLCPSGHLMSTAEVEAALTEHPAVAEAAVVSRPHKVKGECLYCFVTLKDSMEFNHTTVEELKRQGEALTVPPQITCSEDFYCVTHNFYKVSC